MFDSVLEYPLVLTIAAFVCLGAPLQGIRLSRLGRGALLGLVPAGAMYALHAFYSDVSSLLGVEQTISHALRTPVVIALPLLSCFLLVERPLQYAVALFGCFIVGSFLYSATEGKTLLQERSYFGVHRVIDTERYDHAHLLQHGRTIHGIQGVSIDKRGTPRAYYHEGSPIGQVFERFGRQIESIAVIVLGAGTLASYSRAGQQFTFFEIDPAVVQIAEDQRYFSYLADARSRGANISTGLGDARLTLADAPDGGFDLLVLDAFSSDAIPLHLLTLEAVQLYERKLAPDGVIAFHISNHYLDLKPVLATLLQAQGLLAFSQDATVDHLAKEREGKLASQWVVATHSQVRAAALIVGSDGWSGLKARPESRLWTDEYSNIFEVLKF